MLKGIIEENLPNLKKEMVLHTQEARRTPKYHNESKTTVRRNSEALKCLRQNIVKMTRNKKQITYKRIPLGSRKTYLKKH